MVLTDPLFYPKACDIEPYYEPNMLCRASAKMLHRRPCTLFEEEEEEEERRRIMLCLLLCVK